MTELLRRSGIISKHITEFEKWKLIDTPDTEQKTAEMMIEDLVAEIDELLENEPIIKQTLIAPIFAKRPPRLWNSGDISFHAVMDEMGRLVADPKTVLYRGDVIWCEDSVHTNYSVVEVEDLYEGERVVAKMITIEQE